MPDHKFKIGDLVHINKKMPPMMSHFTCDKDAIVVQYSHNECQKGNMFEHSYSLFIKSHGETAWYHDSNLKLIKHNQFQLLEEWWNKAKEEERQKSNLDWIFKNGNSVLKSAHGSTVSALAACLGCSNLWGSRGEGFVYCQNAIKVLTMATPFLETSDRSGWLEFSKEYKNQQNKDRG
jgi:hypothetical protein